MKPDGGGSNARTSPDAVCVEVRRRIIAGEYRPGQRLTEEALADEHGVSRIPVREAIRVLASEGFLRMQPYYGTFVAELTPADANDLLEVRLGLEPLAARLAAQRRTADHIAELKALIMAGRRAVVAGEYADVAALNGRFHELLAVASANASLRSFIRQLRDKIDWVYSVQVRRRADDSWEEHAAIVSAIEARDADRAAALVEQHIARATAAYEMRDTWPSI